MGGIRRAAQALDIDHAAVSRHLRSLEAWTAMSLIDRTQGSRLPTEEGLRYHQQIAAAIDTIASATADLVKLADDHSLRIACVPGFAYQWLLSRLGTFEQANPTVQADLHPTEAAPDFARHEADVYIGYQPHYALPSEVPLPLLRSVDLAQPPVFPVASPDYAAKLAAIQRPDDLLPMSKLHEEDFGNWRAWFDARGVATADEDLNGPRFWHGHLTIEAARRGRGVALANHFLVADDLASGRLMELGRGLPGFERVALGSYRFVARSDRWTSPPVARFRQWLATMIRRDTEAS
ncbi:MAG: LysR substrate-binding domain-containing protein [Sphingobium sp.]